MRFGYAIAYVREVERSVAFYERAFGLRRRFVDESGQYAEMETGETTLAFASNELGRSNLPGGFRENDPAEPPAGGFPATATAARQSALRSPFAARGKG
jgi:lactoylglutathione lyase